MVAHIMFKGDEALVSCGIMESLIRVINWYDSDDGQDHITVSYWAVILFSANYLINSCSL